MIKKVKKRYSASELAARRRKAQARVDEISALRLQIEGWVDQFNAFDMTAIGEIRRLDTHSQLMALCKEADVLSEAERDEHINDILYCRMAGDVLRALSCQHPDDLRKVIERQKLDIRAPKPGRKWREYAKVVTTEMLAREQLAKTLAREESLSLAAVAVRQTSNLRAMVERWVERLKAHDQAVLEEICVYDEIDPALDVDPIAAAVLSADDFKSYSDNILFLRQLIRDLQIIAAKEPGIVWEELKFVLADNHI